MKHYTYGLGNTINKTYDNMTKPYYDAHKKQLEEIYTSYPRSRNLDKTFIDCPCGTEVRLSSLKYHLCTKKHRKVCGDLPILSAVEQPLETRHSTSSISFSSSFIA
jgi:hypothetical protein